MEATPVDMADLDAVRAAMRPNTKLVWAETPSNPLMKVVDLRALISIAHEGGAKILVDNTFATPVLQRPLDLGADVVLHSTTKYFGGHSDAQGGVLIFRESGELVEQILHNRYLLGPVASPFNSWLILRGIRTLACRVERHADNAMSIAKALEKHPAVERVFYPGLPSDPGHEIASIQMRKFGGMLSFLVAGGRERAVEVASKLQLFVNATSLGGTESLIEHRASSEGPTSTTPQNLLRVSAGLEHADDLIEDLMQALG
jgi:Cystathionine beta-lyases/cystathionine gamma-synthases